MSTKKTIGTLLTLCLITCSGFLPIVVLFSLNNKQQPIPTDKKTVVEKKANKAKYITKNIVKVESKPMLEKKPKSTETSIVGQTMVKKQTVTALNPKPVPKSNISQPTLSAYQHQMLVRIISAEAKGEPLKGQVAVGAVILNRIKSGKFPNTVAANVLKRGEFEPVSNGQIWSNPVSSAYQAAQLALQGWDPTYGALYFYNPDKTSSRWIQNRPTIIQIGDHVFAG